MAGRDLVLIGRVARAHGNRGQVIVNVESDFAEDRFQAGRVVQLGAIERAAPRRIDSVRFHQGRPIVAFEGVATMNDAEALAGTEVWMEAADLGPLPPETFYRHDLIGCEVRTESGQVVGQVSGVEGTLERSYLVVKGTRGDVLIPLAAPICVKVDPAARAIVIDPPDGLLEINDSRSRQD